MKTKKRQDETAGGLVRVSPSAMARGYRRRRKGAAKAGLERSIADVKAMRDVLAEHTDPYAPAAEELRGALATLAWRSVELHAGGRDALWAVERAMRAEPAVADLLVAELLATLDDVRADRYARGGAS